MSGFVKLVLTALGVGFWWRRMGGREYMLGDGPYVDDAQVIRKWMTVRPPNFKVTFTGESIEGMRGATVVKDGEEVGEILEAKRTDIGWAEVRYEIDRSRLGYPITVAIAEAEMYVERAVVEFAVPTG